MAGESFTCEVQGLRELGEALANIAPKIARKYLRKSVYSGAIIVRDEARMRVPIGVKDHWSGAKSRGVKVRAGNLKRGIRPKLKRGTKSTEAIYEVGLSGKAFYGKFLEFGTSKMSARPFLRPALDTKAMSVIYAVQQKLDELIGQEQSWSSPS